MTAHNDNFRSPEKHRSDTAAWAATAPPTDGKIWGRATKPKSPKHAHLADEFRPLLKWIAFWEAAEADPAPTNWMASPDLVFEPGDEEDEDEYVGPSNEGTESHWLPKTANPAEALLGKMFEGVIMEHRPECIVRRIDPETVLALSAQGRSIKTGTVAGELRAIEIVETRQRLVIVGGDVEYSQFSGRLVRAGDILFNDGPRIPDAVNDDYEDDEEAGLVAVDRFVPGLGDLPGDDDEVTDEVEDVPVAEETWRNDRPSVGSIRGFRHTFYRNRKTIVVPLKTKLRFTERKSAPPPARDILTVAQMREARDVLAFAWMRLSPETVLLLEQYRARGFKQIGDVLGKSRKPAGRTVQAAMLAACAEWAAVLAEYEAISAGVVTDKVLRMAA